MSGEQEFTEAVREAIESELMKIMEKDCDFDGFGVNTPETNALAQAAVAVMVERLGPPF